MERVTFEEYEAAKAAVLYGKEYEETSSMENNVIHKQYVCKDGSGIFYERTENGVTEFWSTEYSKSRIYADKADEKVELSENRKKAIKRLSLTGRLTREPELRYGGQDNSTAITRFTLAVDDGKDTDFINIKCFGRTAEWAQKWLSKGSRVEVTGKIKTGSYESQRTGSKVYYTEVVANSVGFGESKAEAEARGQQLPESDGFMNIPEGADEELPFN